MKYLSTFSGIGGFELGIQLAYEKLCIKNKEQGVQGVGDTEGQCGQRNNISPVGLTCIGYSEFDPACDKAKCKGYHSAINKTQSKCNTCGKIKTQYAIQTYQKHFPTHHNYGDITLIDTDTLPDFDLLVGGFPCQSFSIAGKRGGFNDTRGTMFFELARILRAKQPRLFCFENVKGLLSHDNGKTFATIIKTLDELGYDLQWQVLNSKNHGVPQNRERVFIIGHLRGTSRPEVFPLSGTVGKDIIVNGVLDTETWRKRHEQIRRTHDTNGISPTLPTGTGGGVMTKIKTDLQVRRLTPTECERLQGFPDGHTEGVSDTQRYKQCGNAVTVNVIKDIMERLLT